MHIAICYFTNEHRRSNWSGTHANSMRMKDILQRGKCTQRSETRVSSIPYTNMITVVAAFDPCDHEPCELPVPLGNVDKY